MGLDMPSKGLFMHSERGLICMPLKGLDMPLKGLDMPFDGLIMHFEGLTILLR